MKDGPSKSLVAKGKQFDVKRRNNSEFGRRAKASAIVLNAMQHLRPLADYRISASINAILKLIQALDTTSTFGERPLNSRSLFELSFPFYLEVLPSLFTLPPSFAPLASSSITLTNSSYHGSPYFRMSGSRRNL